MKGKSIAFVLLCATVMFSACGGKKTGEGDQGPILRPASIEYSSEDSTTINKLVDKYVELLKANDLQGAADMLYTYRNDSIFPYDEEQKAKFVNGFGVFNIYDCEAKSMTLRSEANNQFDLTVQIMPDGSICENKGVTHLSLNPVLVDGQWYITLLDLDADGVEKTYKKPGEF